MLPSSTSKNTMTEHAVLALKASHSGLAAHLQACRSTTCLHASVIARSALCHYYVGMWGVVRESLTNQVRCLCRDESQPELQSPR
jgi:hypothetical protein